MISGSSSPGVPDEIQYCVPSCENVHPLKGSVGNCTASSGIPSYATGISIEYSCPSLFTNTILLFISPASNGYLTSAFSAKSRAITDVLPALPTLYLPSMEIHSGYFCISQSKFATTLMFSKLIPTTEYFNVAGFPSPKGCSMS